MMATASKEVYVRLLDEGTEVFRPTQAIPLGEGSYRVLPTDGYDPDDEHWEFMPGSIVRCETRILSGKEVLVAVARVLSD